MSRLKHCMHECPSILALSGKQMLVLAIFSICSLAKVFSQCGTSCHDSFLVCIHPTRSGEHALDFVLERVAIVRLVVIGPLEAEGGAARVEGVGAQSMKEGIKF